MAVTYASHIRTVNPPDLSELETTDKGEGKSPVEIVYGKYIESFEAAEKSAANAVTSCGFLRETAQRHVALFDLRTSNLLPGFDIDQQAEMAKFIAQFDARMAAVAKFEAWHATAVVVDQFITNAILPEDAARSAGVLEARETMLKLQTKVQTIRLSLQASLAHIAERRATWKRHIQALQGRLEKMAPSSTSAAGGFRSWMTSLIPAGWTGSGSPTGADDEDTKTPEDGD